MTITTIIPALITLIVGYFLIKFPVSVSVPTDRGMHQDIISSSGGIALLAGFIVGIFLNTSIDIVYVSIIIIGILGFLDDKYSLSKYLRLVIQIGISAFIVNEMIGDDIIVYLLFLIFLSAYTINVYNFMDGIDQLAISQYIFYLIGFSMIRETDLAFFLIFIAFFLINYPKTKLFLGNCGSYLLGLLVIIPILHNGRLGFENLIPYIILMTTFYVDTTYTLIVRFIRKFHAKDSTTIESIKHIMEPHRSHLYQKLALKMNSHSKVVIIIMAYNFIWCLPIFYMAYNYRSYSLIFLFLSIAPYVYYCYQNKAGIES